MAIFMTAVRSLLFTWNRTREQALTRAVWRGGSGGDIAASVCAERAAEADSFAWRVFGQAATLD